MTTKEKVLAKCGEIWEKNFGDPAVWQNSGGWWDVRNKSKTICLQCKESTPESDPVWPIAAQILGIGEKKELQSIGVDYNAYSRAAELLESGQISSPSNDLLWESFRTASRIWSKLSGCEVRNIDELARVEFDKWVATLPADPLQDDRNELKEAYSSIAAPYFDRIKSDIFFNAYKRLAGMEVQND